MPHAVRILGVSDVTHNVRRFRIEKPEGYKYQPGQATDVAIDRDGWREEQRPFTFTSLSNAKDLEFTVKIYPDHDGVTEQMNELKEGDRLLIEDPWGAIEYKGDGYFIAGGAGVTPFLAIIRELEAKGDLDGNTLIFSNKAEQDIICRSEFEDASGLSCVFTVTDQPASPLARGMIDRSFLEAHVDDFSKEFYVCGPPEMVEDVEAILKKLGVDANKISFEE